MHPYQWDARLEPRLQQVAERVGRLRKARLPPAAVQNLRHWFRIHHTYHSNAIEGNRLTLPETRAVLEDGITIAGKPLKDHLEAVNLAQALDFIESLAHQTAPLGEREVRDIHTLILRSIDPENAGAYRRINVRIGGTDYVPPAAVAVPERMRELGHWLETDKPEPPAVVAAIAHAWFETIHPFVDGNGRTGRLLANLLLMRQGYPVTLLRVEERARYYTALDQSHTGDLTSLVELTLESIERSLTEYERIMVELEVQEPAIEYLAERLGAARAGGSPEYLAWKYAVEALQENLSNTAERLQEKLEGRAPGVELSIHVSPITEGSWRQAQSGFEGVGFIQCKSPRGQVTGWLTTRPPKDEHRWLGPKLPSLCLQIHEETPDAPERFVMAVPDKHLFNAAYATGSGRSALGPPISMKPSLESIRAQREARANPEKPPPGVTVKKGVSALQLATDIWTYLIENYLA